MWVTTNLISSQFAPGCRTATVSKERAAHDLSNLDRQWLCFVAQRHDSSDQIHQRRGEVVLGDQDHVTIHTDVVTAMPGTGR